MLERLSHRLDLAALHQPISPLACKYMRQIAPALSFFGHESWGAAAVASAADHVLAEDRTELAALLVRQQEARGASRAAAAAARLTEPGAAAVVTGQQAGLFGGPLFVLYKALATRIVAKRVEAARGRPVVPVFWVASDDHDFAEIRSASVLDSASELRTLRYEPLREPSGQSASRIVLDAPVTALIDRLVEALPTSSARDEVEGLLRNCYAPGETMASAFARLVSALLPDVVVLDPSDPGLKRLATPILSREIREASPTSRLALEIGEALLSAGFHQQVPVRPGFLNLFLEHEGERRALRVEGDGLEIRGLAKSLSWGAALNLLESQPELWSPGVLLRPLVQDHLLPTAAYVAGPAEIAYNAQITPSYAHFGLPRPVIVPRPSLTLVEASQARALEAEALTIADLSDDVDVVLGRWARESSPEVESAFAEAREAVTATIRRVQDALELVDPTLCAAAESTCGRALHQLEGLHEKALRALKRRNQTRSDRLRRTRDALFPGGSLQERGLAFVSILARRGTSFIDELEATLDPWTPGHQAFRL